MPSKTCFASYIIDGIDKSSICDVFYSESGKIEGVFCLEKLQSIYPDSYETVAVTEIKKARTNKYLTEVCMEAHMMATEQTDRPLSDNELVDYLRFLLIVDITWHERYSDNRFSDAIRMLVRSTIDELRNAYRD